MKPFKDFQKLMTDYNMRFGRQYDDVDAWLADLNSRLSIRAMARLIKVDRTVLSRRLWGIAWEG